MDIGASFLSGMGMTAKEGDGSFIVHGPVDIAIFEFHPPLLTFVASGLGGALFPLSGSPPCPGAVSSRPVDVIPFAAPHVRRS